MARTLPVYALVIMLLFAVHVHAASVNMTGAVNASAEPAALRALYNAHLDMSVGVVLYGSQYGTGWLLAPYHDIVVTAGHVVSYNPKATVVFQHGGFRTLGRVVYVDRLHDVAIIRLREPWSRGHPLPLCADVPKGETLLVVGYPFELLEVTGSIERMSSNPRAAFGIVTWIDRDRGIFEFQADTDQGNSGGPIVDLDSGCVLGLVSFALKGTVGVTYFGTMAGWIERAARAAGLHPKVVENLAAPLPETPILQRNRPVLLAAIAAGLAALALFTVWLLRVRP